MCYISLVIFPLLSSGVTYPSGAAQKELLKEVYAEVDVNPADVSYMEAHGTGTKTGDPEEVNAITDVFCAARTSDNPLLIGSVKSNMGHSEGASGLAGVTKVLLSMQHGILPANLHYKNPNPNIPALIDGRVKVCDIAVLNLSPDCSLCKNLQFQVILSHGPAMKLMLDIVIENTQDKV